MTNTDWVMVGIIALCLAYIGIMYLIDQKNARDWNEFVRNVIEDDDLEAQRIAERMMNPMYVGVVIEQPEQDEYIRWLYPEAQKFVVRYNPIEGDFSDRSPY